MTPYHSEPTGVLNTPQLDKLESSSECHAHQTACSHHLTSTQSTFPRHLLAHKPSYHAAWRCLQQAQIFTFFTFTTAACEPLWTLKTQPESPLFRRPRLVSFAPSFFRSRESLFGLTNELHSATISWTSAYLNGLQVRPNRALRSWEPLRTWRCRWMAVLAEVSTASSEIMLRMRPNLKPLIKSIPADPFFWTRRVTCNGSLVTDPHWYAPFSFLVIDHAHFKPKPGWTS